MKWTKKKYDEYMSKFDNRIANKVANNKPIVRNVSLAAQAYPRFDGPVSISIHSIRHKLTDCGGACAKYVIDAIVSAGILPDDNPKIIPESPKETQEKGVNEKVIITIRSI